MKHILIDGIIFGLQKSGGISRIWAELLLGLEETYHDFRVTVLVPSNQNIEWQELARNLKKIRVVKRKRFRHQKTSFFQDSLYLTALAFYFKPDIWHSSFYVGMPFAFCNHKIISFHDMIAEKLEIATPYDTELKKKSLKTANLILSPSYHSKKDLIQFWPDLKAKIKILPHACPKLPEKLPPSKEKDPYLLFVGKRGGYKNFLPAARTLLDSSQFSHLKIITVGGEENLSSEEKKLFENSRIEKRGILSSEEVLTLIAGCEALLFPSLYEGFGLPVLEALYLGVPVLAINTASIPEITGIDYPLAESENPESLIKTLKQLLSERAKWSAYGKARCLLFARDEMVQSYLKLYQNVA